MCKFGYKLETANVCVGISAASLIHFVYRVDEIAADSDGCDLVIKLLKDVLSIKNSAARRSSTDTRRRFGSQPTVELLARAQTQWERCIGTCRLRLHRFWLQ